MVKQQLLEIVYYTDPYCTWCWGSEPILLHLKETLKEQPKITYKMGGLVKDIAQFYDLLNQISSIEQVGPHWLEASERHGMPVDIQVFSDIKEEFRSTYPANISYKAAQFQDEKLAERFLRRMREAAASERKAIHRSEVLADLAQEVGLDKQQFLKDLQSEKAKQAFFQDLQEARRQGISGFPTFKIVTANSSIILRGYRSYASFIEVIKELVPTIKVYEPPPLEELLKKYGHLATQEIAEVYGYSREEAETVLKKLAKIGKVREVPRGNGSFWEPSA